MHQIIQCHMTRRLSNNELEIMEKGKGNCLNEGICVGICLVELQKTTKNLSE